MLVYRSVAALVCALAVSVGASAFGAPVEGADLSQARPGDHVSGQVIVRFTEPLTPSNTAQRLNTSRYQVLRTLIEPMGIYLVGLPAGMSVPAAAAELRRSPWVRYAQPDHVLERREEAEAHQGVGGCGVARACAVAPHGPVGRAGPAQPGLAMAVGRDGHAAGQDMRL